MTKVASGKLSPAPSSEEVVHHVCMVCGAKWDCGSRSCHQLDRTVCHKCPCGLPLCGLEKKNVVESSDNTLFERVG